MKRSAKKGMPPDRFIVNRRREELANQLRKIVEEFDDLNRIDWLLDDAIIKKMRVATTKGTISVPNPELVHATAMLANLRRSGHCHEPPCGL